MIRYFKIAVFLMLVVVLGSFGLPQKISKKVNKEISLVFGITDFSTKTIVVSSEVNTLLPTKIKEDNLFEIHQNEKLVGYFYIGKAPSKTDQFDYMVTFDTKLNVRKAKVLIYREDYGNEIGSKRWLKQFIGKSSDDNLKYGQNVDAISGATISANSMTIAMNNLLQTITILNEQHIF
jgi:Na+-translocating ferredoxin:NAD+ oxidoreductase RnfG subunit